METTLEGDSSGSTWHTPSTNTSFNSVVLALQSELGAKATPGHTTELLEAIQLAGHEGLQAARKHLQIAWV